jgi:hypothetical protein
MKNKTTQGLGNRNLLSFPKHDSLKYWLLNKQYNMCKSIRIAILISDLSGGNLSTKKVHVQITWNFRLQKIAQVVMSQNWLRIWPGVGTYFVIDIWVWIRFFYILMVGSAKCLTRKTFLFGGATLPAINDDWSLISLSHASQYPPCLGYYPPSSKNVDN